MINVNFVGRLGNDSEIRESNGKQFISMRVAVDDYNFSTKEKITQWVNVTSHNTNVMNMQQYLKKGSSVMFLFTVCVFGYFFVLSVMRPSFTFVMEISVCLFMRKLFPFAEEVRFQSAKNLSNMNGFCKTEEDKP